MIWFDLIWFVPNILFYGRRVSMETTCWFRTFILFRNIWPYFFKNNFHGKLSIWKMCTFLKGKGGLRKCMFWTHLNVDNYRRPVTNNVDITTSTSENRTLSAVMPQSHCAESTAEWGRMLFFFKFVPILLSWRVKSIFFLVGHGSFSIKVRT